MENIHPIFDKILGLEQKEMLLDQNALVIWLVGLSGSGKSTLARALENSLFELGHKTMLLDGDNLRTGINNNLGFSPEDREENIRRTAEVAKLFASTGIVTICSLISPTDKVRSISRKIIGSKYYEVFVKCPLEVCEERDVKGLYKKARNGEIKDFTGISAPFEEPVNAELTVDTSKYSIEVSLKQLLDGVMPKIKRDNEVV